MLNWKAVVLIRRTIEKFLEDNCTHIAAGVAYYTLFSMFPLLLAAVSILGFVLGSRELENEIIERVGSFVPTSERLVADTIRGVIRARGATGLVATLGLLWSGTAIFAAIRRSLNIAWGIKKPRPFLQQKAIELAMLLSLGGLLVISISITTGISVVRKMSASVPWVSPIDGNLIWDTLMAAVPTVFTFTTFLLLYRFGPNAVIRWRDVWLGALVAALGFEVAKNVFVWYAQNVATYNLVYGSLGTVVAFLMWAYISVIILLFGAELSVAYSQVILGSSGRHETKPSRDETVHSGGSASPSTFLVHGAPFSEIRSRVSSRLFPRGRKGETGLFPKLLPRRFKEKS